jgi:AhpD family alkylhydroperoxidase
MTTTHEHTHDTTAVPERSKTDRSYAPRLRRAAPTEAAGYTAFAEAALKNADGQIPLKYRELIAIGVALTTQCEMCLDSHVAAAVAAGATQEEIAETTFVTAALRAGAAYTHGMKAMRMLAEQA